MANEHIQTKGTWQFMSGQPLPYLNALRDGKFYASHFPPEKRPFPPGKYRFDKFVTDNGGVAPRMIAVIANGEATRPPSTDGAPIPSFLNTLPPGRYFCKPDDGGCGTGAIRLDVDPSGLHVNGGARDPADLAALLADDTYVVQESLTPAQHADIARFNPEVINTVRIVTFESAGGIEAVSASLRVGAGNVVDNWAAGGVGVPVDMRTGRLQGFGTVKEGLVVVDRFPRSGEPLAGHLIPHFAAAVRLVCSLHQKLPANSIGWDVAILERGPAIIECNLDWQILFSAQLDPDFIAKFLAFHLPPKSGSAVRLTFRGDFSDYERVRMWLCAVLGNSLVSGKVEHLSAQRLTVIIAGAADCLEPAMQRLAKSASQFMAAEIKAARGPDRLAPGFDMSAALDPADNTVAAVSEA